MLQATFFALCSRPIPTPSCLSLVFNLSSLVCVGQKETFSITFPAPSSIVDCYLSTMSSTLPVSLRLPCIVINVHLFAMFVCARFFALCHVEAVTLASKLSFPFGVYISKVSRFSTSSTCSAIYPDWTHCTVYHCILRANGVT